MLYLCNGSLQRSSAINPLIRALGSFVGGHMIVTTSKESTNQHSRLRNRFLRCKYTQPLLGNALANEHVPTEMIGVQQWTVFPARSMPLCYNRDKFSS
jgi:hypothetical protein